MDFWGSMAVTSNIEEEVTYTAYYYAVFGAFKPSRRQLTSWVVDEK